MTLFNADGGPAEMSGNGIRCLAWVAVQEGRARDGRRVVLPLALQEIKRHVELPGVGDMDRASS